MPNRISFFYSSLLRRKATQYYPPELCQPLCSNNQAGYRTFHRMDAFPFGPTADMLSTERVVSRARTQKNTDPNDSGSIDEAPYRHETQPMHMHASRSQHDELLLRRVGYV